MPLQMNLETKVGHTSNLNQACYTFTARALQIIKFQAPLRNIRTINITAYRMSYPY
jgi:hypothetical protein